MKIFSKLTLLTGLSFTAFALGTAFGATVIVSDDFTAVNVNSGFLPGEGLNSGIDPANSITRLTGTAAANLRYLKRGAKNDSAYTIASNKANMTQGAQSGRFTISEDGANPFDFGPALGVAGATPENPLIYDVGIAMNNKVTFGAATVGRMTFAFGTVEGGGGNWSFGIQIVPVVSGDVTNYNIIRRIKTAASGLATEMNLSMTNAGASKSEISFLMRFTDAGAETDTNYHSRVQVSMDAGATWFYDTQSDPALTNGWRFEAATRFVSFDQAPNSGADTYDDFSISFPDLSSGGTLMISNNEGNANLSFQGNPNQIYIIERSEDLTNWSGIFTNTTDESGLLQFSETPPTNAAFYRSRAQ
jgi:hypothetical protein